MASPIDYICSAGALNSLFVGTGNIIYCAFANKPASSIKTPMKYTIISTNALVGGACGALICGLTGWVVSTLGTSGESQNDKTNKIVSKHTKIGAAAGTVIGGAGGAAFGFCIDKLMYNLVEKTLQTVPREVIVGATIATAGVVVGTAAYQYTKSYFHNDPINNPGIGLAGELGGEKPIEDTNY
ncbi:MAG TPA: hypothetical protein QKA08_00090 [Candidatus Megaira endosymbiont of Nemacystus decipiens]|nr:hypothetical protein [Candidatus Megaera endosymbiont of Nemacystus decipiens]